MSKVFALHYFEVKPDMTVEDLERFLVTHPYPTLPGWRTYYIKGERGERKGKYAILHEFDSAEIRDRYFPNEDGLPNPEFQALLNSPQMQSLRGKWGNFATSPLYAIYTDYTVIG